jgi:hypothetical protein
MRLSRPVLIFCVAALNVVALLLIWFTIRRSSAAVRPADINAVQRADDPVRHSQETTAAEAAPTNVYAHNLLLRKGPNFRFYVRWLKGQLMRSQRDVNPTFDDPESFYLQIKTGVLRANIGDIGNFLNASGMKDSPLSNIKLSGEKDQIKLNATLHKGVPLPIEVRGTLAVVEDNKIRLHVTKLNVLKVPMKAFLGKLSISISDLFHSQDMPGIRVAENDIIFDTQKLLPPPHIRGKLTAVRVVLPDLEEVYGEAADDVSRVEQWRNFLRLRGGTIDFGKLTMRHVDLIMIDISKDRWFDLDLVHYQEQLVNGYTRMTPQAGLQIFMPDRREIPRNKTTQNISIEWLKNRNVPPPPEVTPD